MGRDKLFKVFILNRPFPKQTLVFTCLQYKSIENTVGKGEIAHNEQFLLFPTVFSTRLENFPLFSSNLKFVVWERVKTGNMKCIFYLS